MLCRRVAKRHSPLVATLETTVQVIREYICFEWEHGDKRIAGGVFLTAYGFWIDVQLSEPVVLTRRERVKQMRVPERCCLGGALAMVAVGRLWTPLDAVVFGVFEQLETVVGG